MKVKNRKSLFGMLFCIALAVGQIGCGGRSAMAPPAPPPVFQLLTITTNSLPNGTVNARYGATLQTSGGTPPVNWRMQDASLPPGLSMSSTGAISGTPTAPGLYLFILSVTDSSTPPQGTYNTFSIGINQNDSSHNALLKGRYAFRISRFDLTRNKDLSQFLAQISTAGSFVADGAGNIRGVSDTNGPPATEFTGTYALGADNRGTMSINNRLLAFSVGSISASGVAGKGHLIDFAEFSTVSEPGAGEFELQDSSAFSNSAVSGSYAFGLSGEGFGADGIFVADGNGGIVSGSVDLNGIAAASQPLTGTYNIVANSTDGRGTGTLMIAGTTFNFALYVVSAGKMFIVGNGPFTGEARKQSGGPFSSSSLSGTSIFRTAETTCTLQSLNCNVIADVTAGLETFDGKATVMVLQDQNANGALTLDSTSTETYNVENNGRVTVTAAGVPVSVRYLVSPGTGFILNADRSTGFLEAQSVGPFAETSIDGNFVFGDLPLAYEVSAGTAMLNAGNISLTSYRNEQGTLIFTQSSQGTYAVAPNGRATTGSGNQVIYIISPTKFLMLDVNPTKPTPGIAVAEQ